MGVRYQKPIRVRFSYEPGSLWQILEELTTPAGVIREAVSFAHANIRNKFIGELAKQNGAECGARKADVIW